MLLTHFFAIHGYSIYAWHDGAALDGDEVPIHSYSPLADEELRSTPCSDTALSKIFLQSYPRR
jgi:hypothetical protein